MRKILLIWLFVLPVMAGAQFYNGHQMTFGKSRVQYQGFVWQFLKYKRFDTYFYVGGRELAEYVAREANRKINQLEYRFQFAMNERMIFIIYNKHSDFRQSNIGLISGNEEYNIGGTTHIIDNKIFIYYEGDHVALDRQISEAVVQLMLKQMLYGGNFREMLSNSTFLNLPSWYEKGLVAYMSEGWSIETDNRVKDAFSSGKYKRINWVDDADARYLGQSLWYFIAENYGESIIPNILYLTRISKSVENGFMYVLGMGLKDVIDEWRYFFESRYQSDDKNRSLPNVKPVLKRPHKTRVFQNVKISPDGAYLAYSTNESGQYRVFIYDIGKRKTRQVFRREHRLQQLVDYSYPVLEWSPDGDYLTFITEIDGSLFLYYYDMKKRELEKRELFYIEKVLDYDFAPGGNYIAMSVVHDGRTDLWIFNLLSGNYEKVTNDLPDDLHPRYTKDGKNIIISSNRDTEIFENDDTTYTLQPNFDLYVYNLAKKNKKFTRLSETRYDSEDWALENIDSYAGISNSNGIYNWYDIKYDSTILMIDTTIHYRHFSRITPLTDYRRSLLSGDIHVPSGKKAEILYNNNRYFMYIDSLSSEKPLHLKNTWYKSSYNHEMIEKDSLIALGIDPDRGYYDPYEDIRNFSIDTNLLKSDIIDVNNYVFEFEKKRAFLYRQTADSLISAMQKEEKAMSRPFIYLTSFYTNFVVNQIDFGFLNNSYQAFTGGAVYFNPGLNIMTKIGTVDLFEDYKVTGGFSLSGDFDANEFLISVEDLKHRLDRQLILHRQAFKIEGLDFLAKTHTHEAMYSVKYPFSQVASVKTTLSVRHDRTVFLSSDINTLNASNIHKVWNGIKCEYVFDNTFPLGLNLFSGTRLKVFGEFYKQVGYNINQNLFVVGADVRNYLRIYRQLIWANRFACSGSFGNALLIYYLGGVDNWINFSPRTPTFNYSVPIDENKNYVYQTVATNMRGFSQNIRNGTSFMLINSEIRWPVIRFFVNRPLSNDFLNNFTIAGFFDVGSAWTGWFPWNSKNAYDYEEIHNGPITVIIDKGKNPFVAGYGFGLRSRLLGYYVRTDWAWGIDNGQILPRVFYLSLMLDF